MSTFDNKVLKLYVMKQASLFYNLKSRTKRYMKAFLHRRVITLLDLCRKKNVPLSVPWKILHWHIKMVVRKNLEGEWSIEIPVFYIPIYRWEEGNMIIGN
jgi:hypothetical protein